MTSPRITRLEEMIASDPGDPFTRYALALEWSAAGDVGRAISLLEELRVGHPDYVPAYHQLGLLYSRSDERSRSRDAFLAGIEAAQRMGDSHAAREMREALEELE